MASPTNFAEAFASLMSGASSSDSNFAEAFASLMSGNYWTDLSRIKKHKYHDYLNSVYNKIYGHDFAFASEPTQEQYDEFINNFAANYKTDLEYLDSIEQYRGTEYYDTLYNNPHLKGRLPGYTPTAVEQIGDFLAGIGSFGATTDLFSSSSAERYYADQQNLSNAYLAEQVDKMRQEEHNSAPAQTEQLRNAGLNPDLTGGVQAGAAAENDQPIQSPQMPDQSSGLTSIATTVSSVFSMAMNMAQQFQALSANEIQLGINSLDLYSRSNNAFIESISNYLTEDELRILLEPNALGEDGKPLFSTDEFLAASDTLEETLSHLENSPLLPRSLRKKISKSFKVSERSIRSNTEIYKMLEEAYKHKKGAVENMGHPFSNGGFEECITLFGKHVNDTVIEIQKLQAKFDKERLSSTDSDGNSLGSLTGKADAASLNYDIDRLGVTSNGKSLGTLAGESDAAAYTAEAYQKQYDAIVNKMWDDVMKSLQKENTWWSKLLQFAIPVVRLWLGNIKMPSVSHSTQSGINGQGMPVSSSSTSFGF